MEADKNGRGSLRKNAMMLVWAGNVPFDQSGLLVFIRLPLHCGDCSLSSVVGDDTGFNTLTFIL